MTMKKIKVLFFAADPLSAPPKAQAPRLMLDEDVRRIQRKVRAAEYRDALEFDFRWAPRADDLLQALYESPPQVVHFSGHGGSDGLVLVGPDGHTPHFVDAATLAQLFRAFRGDIQVVVLNACFSLPQAEAIAGVVGCAIGTRGEISDKGAITFGASFYRALAFGRSVKDAFEQARVALALDHVAEREYPHLVVAPGVDASELFLIEPGGPEAAAPVNGGETKEIVATPRQQSSTPLKLLPATSKRGVGYVRKAVGGLALGAAVLLAIVNSPKWSPMSCNGAPESIAERAPQTLTGGPPPPVSTAGLTQGAGSELTHAIDLYHAGNYAAAFPLFKQAAARGNTEAMGYLGVLCLRGLGTARNLAEGVDWLRQAAYKRDAHAMTELGVAYRDGVGVGRSIARARKWFRIAADSAHYGEAMRNMGALDEGEGDFKSAREWFQKAVNAGYTDALVDLGKMREEGLGTPPDKAEARDLYFRAAHAGSARGMLATGWAYQHGVGVPQDYKQAMAWYIKAEEAGSVDAMNNIGVLYQNGWGVKRDRDVAIGWFRKASQAGSTIAAANLASLGAK